MKIKLIVFGLFFYLASLLLSLPATMVVSFLPEDVDIKLNSVSGSLWQGQIAEITYQKKYKVKKVTWKFDWVALFALQLKLDLKFNNGVQALSGKGVIGYSLTGAFAENLMIDIKASELLSYLPLPVPITATGDISLIIKSIAQGTPYCQEIDGYLHWQDAKLKTDLGNINLATVNIALTCVDGLVQAQLKQDSDQLTTQASFVLKEKGVYQLNGAIKGKAKLEPSINQALSWIGKKDAQGATLFKFNGVL